MIGAIWMQSSEGVLTVSGFMPWKDDVRVRRAVERVDHLMGTSSRVTVMRPSSPDLWWLTDLALVIEPAIVDLIDVTYVPYTLPTPPPPDVLFAPAIDEAVFAPGPLWGFEGEPDITHRTYVRRTLSVEPYELADNRRILEGGILRPAP